MNVSCAICAEMFKNVDSSNINITQCGHVFHRECLKKWLDRSKTCPECRHKTTTAIRVFYNIVSYSEQVDSSTAGEFDGTALQSENDNLKFKIIEKDGVIKAKDKTIDKLSMDNANMKNTSLKSKEVILRLEREIDKYKIIQNQHLEQITCLKTRLNEVDRLKAQLAEANDRLSKMESIKRVLLATKSETDKLLQEKRTVDEMATMISALKTELVSKSSQQKEMRLKYDELNNKLQKSKEEKSELEEQRSMLESKIFQLETASLNRSKENNEQFNSPVISKDAVTSEYKRQIKIETKTKSPFLNIRSSALAGLSVKRPPSKLTAESGSKEFTIFKKPRLTDRAKKA